MPSQLAFQLSGAPAPQVTAFAFDDAPRVSFTTTVGQSYRVEYQSDVSQNLRATVSGAEMIAGTGGVVDMDDPDPNAINLPRRFYRVVLL